jgi:hypothetical protein
VCARGGGGERERVYGLFACLFVTEACRGEVIGLATVISTEIIHNYRVSSSSHHLRLTQHSAFLNKQSSMLMYPHQ